MATVVPDDAVKALLNYNRSAGLPGVNLMQMSKILNKAADMNSKKLSLKLPKISKKSNPVLSATLGSSEALLLGVHGRDASQKKLVSLFESKKEPQMSETRALLDGARDIIKLGYSAPSSLRARLSLLPHHCRL